MRQDGGQSPLSRQGGLPTAQPLHTPRSQYLGRGYNTPFQRLINATGGHCTKLCMPRGHNQRPKSGVPADLRVPRGNKSAVCEGLATPSAPAACGQPKPTNPTQRECYKAIKAKTVGARVYTHPTGHAHAKGIVRNERTTTRLSPPQTA